MKKLLALLLLFPLFISCSSDDENEKVDLTKYPLANTKWIYYDKAGVYKGNNPYYIFGKEDGILMDYVITDRYVIPIENSFFYTHNGSVITFDIKDLDVNPVGKLIGDSLYTERVVTSGLVTTTLKGVYYKDKTY